MHDDASTAMSQKPGATVDQAPRNHQAMRRARHACGFGWSLCGGTAPFPDELAAKNAPANGLIIFRFEPAR